MKTEVELSNLNDAISIFCANHECKTCPLGYSEVDCIIMMAWRKLDRARLAEQKRRRLDGRPF